MPTEEEGRRRRMWGSLGFCLLGRATSPIFEEAIFTRKVLICPPPYGRALCGKLSTAEWGTQKYSPPLPPIHYAHSPARTSVPSPPARRPVLWPPEEWAPARCFFLVDGVK